MFGDILEGIDDGGEPGGAFMLTGGGAGPGTEKSKNGSSAPSQGAQQMQLLRPSTPGGSTLVAKKVGVQTGLIASNHDKLPGARKAPMSKPILVLHDEEDDDGTPDGVGSSITKVIVKPSLDAKVGVVTVTRRNEQGGEVGAQVHTVIDEGLAAKAGLKPGDVVHKINGVSILRHDQFADAIKSAEGEVKLEVMEGLPLEPDGNGEVTSGKKGKQTEAEKETKAKQQPPPPSVTPAAFDTVKREVVMNKQTADMVLGIVAVDVGGADKDGGGVEVKEVKDGGLASAAGLVPGDVIKRLNGLVVARHEMFTELIKSAVGEVKLELVSRKMQSEKAPAVEAKSPRPPSEATSPNPIIPYPHQSTSPSLRRAS